MNSRLKVVGMLWLPPLVWMGLIFLLSSQQDVPGPPQPLLDLILKKGSHFLGYGILAVLWVRAFLGTCPAEGGKPSASTGASWSSRLCSRRTLFLAAWGVTVMYAASDEFHQSFVPERHPGLVDVFIDGTGAAAALVLLARFNDLFGLPKRES